MHKDFPGISERLKAMVTDYFLLSEPLMISLAGDEIGHHTHNIHVKRSGGHSRNISFPRMVIRFILNFFSGIISFATISPKTQNNAIHDMEADSVVLYKKGKDVTF